MWIRMASSIYWRDTGTGVFLSEDPASYAAGDSSLYRYALNSPGNVVDPGETQGSHADSAGLEEPDSYSNFIYRAVGEQTRAVLGDRFLMAKGRRKGEGAEKGTQLIVLALMCCVPWYVARMT